MIFRIAILVLTVLAPLAAFSAENPPSVFLLDGSEFNIDFKKPNKTTVLVFWASWCSYCIAQEEKTKKLIDEISEVNVVGINVDLKSADGLKHQFEHNLNYFSISDPELEIADQFGVRGTPNFVLLSADGQVLFKSRRMNDEFKNAVLTALQ